MPEDIAVSQSANFVSMIFGSGPVVMIVLWLLIFLSVWSWAISIAKYLHFRRAKKESHEFSEIFWDSKNLSRIEDSARRYVGSPLAKLFDAGYQEFSDIMKGSKVTASADPDNELRMIERALKRAEHEENMKLERGTTFLATVASAAPFIGLFGTVWGIMTSFHSLSSAKSATIQAVAPGISEALIATAVGLAAAIPAAVAYNYFTTMIKHFRISMNNFTAEFLGLAKDHFAN